MYAFWQMFVKLLCINAIYIWCMIQTLIQILFCSAQIYSWLNVEKSLDQSKDNVGMSGNGPCAWGMDL